MDCHSYMNGHVNAGFLLANNVDQNSIPLIFSFGLVHRLNQSAKIIFEIDSGAVFGDYDEVANGFLAFYGARFGGRSVAVNAGLVRPFGPDVDWDEFPLGFPWEGFNYRGSPN